MEIKSFPYLMGGKFYHVSILRPEQARLLILPDLNKQGCLFYLTGVPSGPSKAAYST
ncbi:MAG: hypothetical protein ACPGWR_08475 [Ardenticatenaceae bacterium]